MLEAAFNAFDKDGSGAISSDELKEMLGDEITEENVWAELIQTVDQNGDGEVDLKEFKDMMIVRLD
jgi:calcium-dependent protein kinase